MYNANYSNARKLSENQVLFPNFQRVWLAETNKQKITLLHTFWSQLEVEVSNICKRDYLSDISDMSEARILMKHPDARIPEQKVRSSNKQTFFPLQLWNYKNKQNYLVILWAFFSSVLKSNITIIIKKQLKVASGCNGSDLLAANHPSSIANIYIISIIAM